MADYCEALAVCICFYKTRWAKWAKDALLSMQNTHNLIWFKHVKCFIFYFIGWGVFKQHINNELQFWTDALEENII